MPFFSPCYHQRREGSIEQKIRKDKQTIVTRSTVSCIQNFRVGNCHVSGTSSAERVAGTGNRLTILFGFRDLFFKIGDLTGIDINRD
jgi:hypothetical protein